MNFTDDDIQFLGGPSPEESKEVVSSRNMSPPPANKSKLTRWQKTALAVIVALVLAICALAGLAYYDAHRWAVSFEYPLSRSSEQIIHDLNANAQLLTAYRNQTTGSSPTVQSSKFKVQSALDSIDGVTMRFFDLNGLKASIARTMPADSDSTVMLITQAWDYYYDNSKQYHYLGDFVDNGKQLASGTGKAGFVAITHNGWQMGIGQNDSIKDYVISQGGSMFRQFALVSSGQICLKQFALKGKVHRRALARKPGSVTAYYVETVHKESLYDFAEALADYGFIDAIYLTGADGTEPCYRDATGTMHGNRAAWTKKSNLLIFRTQTP